MLKNNFLRLPQVDIRARVGNEGDQQLRNHERDLKDWQRVVRRDKLSITPVAEHLHRKKQLGGA